MMAAANQFSTSINVKWGASIQHSTAPRKSDSATVSRMEARPRVKKSKDFDFGFLLVQRVESKAELPAEPEQRLALWLGTRNQMILLLYDS